MLVAEEDQLTLVVQLRVAQVAREGEEQAQTKPVVALQALLIPVVVAGEGVIQE